MLTQMDPALVTYCDKIAAQGGPTHMPDDVGESLFPSTPVVQLGTVTRSSARLRNVQPEVNLGQSYEALKRPKKNADAAYAGIVAFHTHTCTNKYYHIQYTSMNSCIHMLVHFSFSI